MDIFINNVIIIVHTVNHVYTVIKLRKTFEDSNNVVKLHSVLINRYLAEASPRCAFSWHALI